MRSASQASLAVLTEGVTKPEGEEGEGPKGVLAGSINKLVELLTTDQPPGMNPPPPKTQNSFNLFL